MNSRNRSNYDPFDVLISLCVKNWLDRHHPPEDAREKLLHTASLESLEKTHVRKLLQSSLQYLTFGISSLLSLNQKQAQYSEPSQKSVPIKINFRTLGAYQVMIRSYPAGRGILGFLY